MRFCGLMVTADSSEQQEADPMTFRMDENAIALGCAGRAGLNPGYDIMNL
jgi:hypothetical protein